MSHLQPITDHSITDVNVYLSRWPCRRLPFDETRELVSQLRDNGVAQAWAGSFDCLLHNDVEAVNRRLTEECRQIGDGMLLPAGCVNPMLPDWQEDLRRCAEVHQMRMIRLHPNYHGYELSDSRVSELLDRAADHNLIMQIALRMEDPRTQHPLLRVPDCNPLPLVKLLKQHATLNVVLLNAMQVVRGSVLSELAALPNVSLETATLEGVGGISRLLKEFPLERILFGSYFPFFILQAALLKLQESEMGAEILTRITHANAERLLTPSH